MIRLALPAAVAALASVVPGAASAQMPPPQAAGVEQQMPGTPFAPPGASPTMGYYGNEGPFVAAPVAFVPVPPGSIWIAGHYNWDPAQGNYTWVAGQFAQPPRPGAQWVEGRWLETPTSWVWVDGHWS